MSARAREIFDRSPVGVVVVSLDRSIHYANAEALRLLGVDAFEGRNLEDAFRDPDARSVLQAQFALRREGVIGSYRVTLRRLSDEQPVQVDVTGVPLTDADGRVVGSLGYFRSLENETLIETIHRLNGEIEDGHKLLLEVARLLAQTFSADMVLVTRYSDNLRHANPFFVYRPGHEKRQIEWRKRWMPLDEALQGVMRSAGTSAIDGLREFLDSGAWKTIRNDPLVQAILEDGQESALTRVVRRRGVVIGAVFLLSRRKAAFDERDCQRLDELPIDATVSHVLDFTRQQQEAERFRLLRELTRSATVKQACEVLSRRLAEIFGWSHVSVFRVDYAARLLHLLAQHSPGKEHILLPEGYRQPIDVGLLGLVVSTRRLVNVGNVSEDPNYIRSVPTLSIASELCCPINFERDDTVRWIINVEDQNEQAFSDNECLWLGEVAAEVGALMERISNLHFLTECFRSTTDPIVVTGPDHEIRKANPAAARLLGFTDPKELKGPLAGLFENADEFERIGDHADGDAGECLLKRADPREPAVPVNLSMQQLPENLGGTIFVLKDLRKVRRTIELELLREVTYGVAVQTRAPLAFAMAALERLRPRLDAGTTADADKVLRQLGRVKLGYARLALFNPETQSSPPQLSRINLAAEVRAVAADLPDAEHGLVRVSADEPAPIVQGDHFRIGFVLETLIAALVRFAPEEEPVVARVAMRDGRARVELSGYLPDLADCDPDGSRLIALQRADIWLARPLMARFMTEHGGTVSEQAGADGRMRFVLEFPALEGTSP